MGSAVTWSLRKGLLCAGGAGLAVPAPPVPDGAEDPASRALRPLSAHSCPGVSHGTPAPPPGPFRPQVLLLPLLCPRKALLWGEDDEGEGQGAGAPEVTPLHSRATLAACMCSISRTTSQPRRR